MKLRLFFFLVLGFLFSTPVSAADGMPYRFGIRASISVPHPLSNKAFRRSFGGVYDATGSFNVNIFSGFTMGIAYTNSLWKTPDNKIPGLNTYMQQHLFGFRVGYEQKLNDQVTFYGGLTAGQGFVQFTGVVCDTVPEQTRYTIRYAAPEIGFAFAVEENLSVGLQLSSVITNFAFDPYKLCLDQHKAYIDSDLNGRVAQFNFGFSVTYSFLKKRGTAP